MIKDALLKVIFIPLLGISLPLIAGIVSYDRYSALELIGAHIFFVLTSLTIWAGCNWIHFKLRPLYSPVSGFFSRISIVCFASGLYGACIGFLSCLLWMTYSRETFNWTGIYKFLTV